MSDANTGERKLPLSDVTLERARQENSTIDEQFSDLEQQVATLKDEKATAEDELESVREEKQALEDVVSTFKATRRDDLLTDLRETIEAAAVDADDLDIDFSELEDADVATLETTKNMVETTIEAAGLDTNPTVSNTDETPDLGGVEGEGDGEDYEEAAAAAADDLGIGDSWQKVQAGESLASGPQAIGNDGGRESDAVQELADIVREVSEQ